MALVLLAWTYLDSKFDLLHDLSLIRSVVSAQMMFFPTNALLSLVMFSQKETYISGQGTWYDIQWDGYRKFTMFEDRIGDTFRWKGENMSTMVISFVIWLMSQEVTTAITGYEGIDDASVYGVALPDDDGQAGCAAVILSSTQPPSRNLFDAFTKYCRIMHSSRYNRSAVDGKYETPESGTQGGRR